MALPSAKPHYRHRGCRLCIQKLADGGRSTRCLLGGCFATGRIDVLECAFGIGMTARRAAGSIACGAACISLNGSASSFARQWRLVLLKHELSCLALEQWESIAAARKWSRLKREQVLTEFSRTAETHLLGITVSIESHAWRMLDARTRLHFRSQDQFCLLRLARLVLDRMETTDWPDPATFIFDQDLAAPGHSRALKRLLQSDTRAARRLASVQISEHRHSAPLQAAHLLAAMTLRDVAQQSKTSLGLPSWLKRLDELPGPASDVQNELWDQAQMERSMGSLEWAIPEVQVRPRRR